MFILFALLFSFLGAGFLVQGITYRHENSRFENERVVKVQGTVDNVINLNGSANSKGGAAGGSHQITYHFSAPDGVHHETTGALPATCDRFDRGETIPIKYLSGQPKLSRIDLPEEDASHRQEVWIDLAAGCFLLPIGLVFLRRWFQVR